MCRRSDNAWSFQYNLVERNGTHRGATDHSVSVDFGLEDLLDLPLGSLPIKCAGAPEH